MHALCPLGYDLTRKMTHNEPCQKSSSMVVIVEGENEIVSLRALLLPPLNKCRRLLGHTQKLSLKISFSQFKG